jgi:hypothetical protein
VLDWSHGQTLVDKLGDKHLFHGPAAAFEAPRKHGGRVAALRRCGVMACDVGAGNTETCFARGDHAGVVAGVCVAGESGGGVAIGADAQGFHPSQLVPLLLFILVAFNALPCK